MFKIPPEKRVLATVLSLLAIAASSVFLWRMFSGPDFRVHQENFIAIGGFAAEAVAERVPADAQVLLITPPVGTSEIMDRQVDAFLQELELRGGRLVAQIEPPSDEGLGEAFFYDMGMPVAVYMELIRPYDEIDYVISFAGPPMAFGEEIEWPENLPQLIVIGSSMYELGAMLKNGKVAWAIGPRMEPIDRDLTPDTPREWFEQNYSIYTAENVDWIM